MIFSILFDVYNLDDKIQVSISKQTMVGDRIVREAGEGRTTDISGNALHTPHPTHDFLVKTDNNYFLLDGSVKVRYEWVDGDKFTDEHKETYRSVVVNSDEHARANTTFNDGVGFMEGTAVLGTTPCDWKDSPVRYEPDCSVASIEIMEQGTRMLCPMQHEAGWDFKKADVAPGGTITATKSGTDCYIVFGQDCTIPKDSFYTANDPETQTVLYTENDRSIGELPEDKEIGDVKTAATKSVGDFKENPTNIPANSIKKLTSDSLVITNVSSKLCRLIKIYK